MPPNTVYVGRPTKWGNPINHQVCGRRKAVTLFRRLLKGKRLSALAKETFADRGLNPMGNLWAELFIRTQHKKLASEIHELRGKNLACWCPLDQPCHADVLLEAANTTLESEGADDGEPKRLDSTCRRTEDDH